jgi:hypothetical protein
MKDHLALADAVSARVQPESARRIIGQGGSIMRGSLTFALIAASLLTTLVTPAHARFATFVAGYGTDVGNCSYSAPCRTLTYALAQVDSKGVVTILDSAGYENITIVKPVTVMAAPGALPSLRTTNTNGAVITINFVGGAVSLIGLTLDGGTQAADTGIAFLFGPRLIIKNSIIKNFSASGIGLTPNMASTMEISDTLVANNGGYGVFLQPPSSVGTVSAVFNHVEAYGNALDGIGVFGNLNTGGLTIANAYNCIAAHNNIGYRAFGDGTGRTAFLRMTKSTASDNTLAGVSVENAAVAYLSQNDMGGFGSNYSNWQTSNSSVIFTYGDNLTENFSPPTGGTPINKF